MKPGDVRFNIYTHEYILDRWMLFNEWRQDFQCYDTGSNNKVKNIFNLAYHHFIIRVPKTDEEPEVLPPNVPKCYRTKDKT